MLSAQELQGLASIIGRPVTPVEEMWAQSVLDRELAALAIRPQQIADYMQPGKENKPMSNNDTQTTPTADIDPGPAPDPTPTPVNEYDLNGDGCVDMADMDILIDAYGTQVGDPAYNAACDFNGDGVVNASDYNLLRRHMGEGCGGGASA